VPLLPPAALATVDGVVTNSSPSWRSYVVTLRPSAGLMSSVTVNGLAPGGTGKSAYAMAVAISLATHKEFLGDHIFAPVNVAVINLDDPMDELERRVAAIMIAHKIGRDELDGRLFLEDCGHLFALAANLFLGEGEPRMDTLDMFQKEGLVHEALIISVG
jgi:hypothetical protein